MRGKYSLRLVLIAGLLAHAQTAFARPHMQLRDKAFEVPAKLRPRVGFWVRIFTQYGEHHEVIHHRAYPQILFRVVDFSAAAKSMGEIELERYRKGEMERQVAQVRAAIKHLAAGAAPRNELETRIKAAMDVLGPGSDKYQAVLDEEMIRSQTGIREKFRQALERSGRYMPMIENIFMREEGLPVELTRLPFIESSFDYKVRSSVGALGIWQFMPATARHHKMMVGAAVDERLDVIESTRAAAKYLRHAYQVLGSWPLAITSYNHGVTGVLRKTKQLGTTDISAIVEHPTLRLLGFASNNFYPEFLAALEVYDNKARYFPGLRIEPPLALVEYRLPHSLSTSYIHQRLGVPVAALMELNYGVMPAVWSGRYRLPKGYNLKVPPMYVNRLSELLHPEPVGPSVSSVYGGVVYKVRKGDTLIKIAKKYDVTVAHLQKLNRLGEHGGIHVGQTLVVREPEDSPGALHRPADVEKGLQIEPEPAHTYTVRAGDTLSAIARSQKVSVGTLRSLNHLKSSHIKPGQVLKLGPVGQPAASAVAPRKKAPAVAKKPQAAKVSTVKRPAGTYTVRKGETLSQLSKKLKVSVAALKKANGLKGDTIKAGQRLVLP